MAKQLIITIEDDEQALEIIENICEAENFKGSIRNPKFKDWIEENAETNPRRLFMSNKSFVLLYLMKTFKVIIQNSKKKIQHKEIDLMVKTISISVDII